MKYNRNFFIERVPLPLCFFSLQIVKPFYDYWENYFTSKSYVWVEKYDTREAPDRRVRRIMEAENKKLRYAARKERNEEVRVRTTYPE